MAGFLAIGTVLALAQDGFVDVGGELEHFQTPIPGLYGEGWDRVVKAGRDGWVAMSGKQVTYDLQRYRGRIYVGHGSTNSKQKTHMLYFDPKTSAYDVDRGPDGKPLAFPEECMAHMRVFDDELYVTSTDQLDGGTKFFRKNRDGTWTIRTVHKEQQHSRDLYKSGPHVFIHFGWAGDPFPSVVYSPDDGRTWTTLVQADLHDGAYIGYSRFFGFQGRVYLTGPAQRWVPRGKGEFEESRAPWILAFTGDAAKPFEVVCRTPADFHPDLLHGAPPKPEAGKMQPYDGPAPAQLWGGITVGGRLILANQGTQVYAVESLHPVKARPVTIPSSPLGGVEGWRVGDFLERPDAAYILLVRRASETTHARVVKSVDGLTWTPVLGFSGPHAVRFLEEVDGDFYFGLPRSELLRVRRAAYAP